MLHVWRNYILKRFSNSRSEIITSIWFVAIGTFISSLIHLTGRFMGWSLLEMFLQDSIERKFPDKNSQRRFIKYLPSFFFWIWKVSHWNNLHCWRSQSLLTAVHVSQCSTLAWNKDFSKLFHWTHCVHMRCKRDLFEKQGRQALKTRWARLGFCSLSKAAKTCAVGLSFGWFGHCRVGRIVDDISSISNVGVSTTWFCTSTDCSFDYGYLCWGMGTGVSSL